MRKAKKFDNLDDSSRMEDEGIDCHSKNCYLAHNQVQYFLEQDVICIAAALSMVMGEMSMKKAYYKTVCTGAVLAALFTGCGAGDGAGQGESRFVQEAEVTAGKDETETSQPAFTCQDMDGNSVTESVFSQSKLTMVNVWATYCNPCLSEMPGLGELAEEYAPETFQIIGIISDVQEGSEQAVIDNAAALIEQTGADYPHLLLNESVYFALLTDVAAVPTTFFVDENGVVVDTVIGAMKKSAWEEKINALLEER